MSWSATRRTHVVVAVAALVAGAAAFFVGSVAFPSLSGNSDEAVYVLQAEILASGSLTIDADLHGGPFQPWLTGEHNGRLFTQYQPGWPAVLAGAKGLGSMRLGVALASAALVVAAASLSWSIYRDHRAARCAAVLTVASPLLFLHSLTFLSYIPSTALLLGASALAIHAVTVERPRLLGLATFALATGLLVRPFDAVLVGGLWLLAFVLHRGLPRWTRDRTLLAAAVIGGLPPLAATLLLNLRVTGEALSFPLSASAPENRFGFGPRSILLGQPTIDYSFDTAQETLWSSLAAVPSWAPFGAVGLALVVVSFSQLRAHRATSATLLLALLSFPLGYLFWWATFLTHGGLVNGLGPHYYVPSFALLTIVAAHGLVVLWSATRHTRPVVLVGVVALGIALTAYNATDKIDDVRYTRDGQERWASVEPPPGEGIALLPDTQRYVIERRGTLVNGPDFDPGLQYAVDDGGANLFAREREPGNVFRLQELWYPGDGLFDPTIEYTPLEYMRAPIVCARLTSDAAGTLAIGWEDDRVMIPDGVEVDISASSPMLLYFQPADGLDPSRAKLRFSAHDDGTVEVEVPETATRRAVFPNVTLWLATRDPVAFPVEVLPGGCGS